MSAGRPLPGPELYTVREVAEYLKCSEGRLRKAVQAGTIGHVRFMSREIRFRAEDVQEYLRVQRCRLRRTSA